ncbi:pyridoxamine 5'-phosphate oxidase family protein [Desulfogranum japonicum]|uniref:pyridoxamine 5'-phosphate oxidase family protein n=1 Tax=Desulfogranum japonicum TaxID=231447 RepID=UPI00040E17E2|nr:pyridoxamine 5'-phosphate oxidase family protein [Desulfogranum japonicum]
MRRQEKEIHDTNILSKIIRQCDVLRLGLSANDRPYIVPLSFGYDGQALYFHTATAGLKIDMLTANNTVCFEFESNVRIISNDTKPCNWSFSFQSVIGWGVAREQTSEPEKRHGLSCIMAQYSDDKWDFTHIPLQSVRVWKIHIEKMTGKQSLDHAH